MRKVFLALILTVVGLALIGCAPEQNTIEPTTAAINKPSGEITLYQDPAQPVEARVKDLLACMTTEEKIGQKSRLGIPLIFGWDAIHGSCFRMDMA